MTKEERLVASLPLRRRVLYALIAVLLAIGGMLLIAELACRLLPINEGLRTLPVNAENPVYRFEPNRTSSWSRDWNFSIDRKSVV